jgi:hypothetical protein
MRYHPEERIILKHTTIRRNRELPPRAFGSVQVGVEDYVESNHVIASGQLPLGIDPGDVETLEKVLEVSPGTTIERGQPLAKRRRRRDRKRIPLAPEDGMVSLIEHGRVILQTNPESVAVYARLPGRVSELLGDKGARLELVGALLQCVWGNGRFLFTSYNFEPPNGLQSLLQSDSLLDTVRGRVYILERPIAVDDFKVVVEKELGGLVAPSMSYHLRETAMALKVPIIVTDGFGDCHATRHLYEILREFEHKRQGAFDATPPDRWTNDRPEIVLPVAAGGQMPPIPALDELLVVGALVRLRRAPYEGQVATVTALPDKPQVIDNGLRVAAAQVKLRSNQEVIVPLANLELLGERS